MARIHFPNIDPNVSCADLSGLPISDELRSKFEEAQAEHYAVRVASECANALTEIANLRLMFDHSAVDLLNSFIKEVLKGKKVAPTRLAKVVKLIKCVDVSAYECRERRLEESRQARKVVERLFPDLCGKNVIPIGRQRDSVAV